MNLNPNVDSSGLPVQTPKINQTTLLAVLWTGTAISIVTVAARLAIRWKLLGNFRVDDYLVIFALILSFASTVIWQVHSGGLYMIVGKMDVTDIPQVLSEATTVLRANLANYICSWTCLWVVKLAFMAFFRDLGRNIKFQKYLWWSILVFIIATWVVCIGVLDYPCLTSSGLQMLERCSTFHSVNIKTANTIVTTLDITTDVFIVALSANIVWRAQIPLKKKLMLVGICSLTVAMAVVAVIRVVLGIPGRVPDVSSILLWTSVEMTLAIFVACIASFRSIYCKARNTSRYHKGTPDRSKTTAESRPPYLSTMGAFSVFGNTTIMDEENAQWDQKEMSESEELPIMSNAVPSKSTERVQQQRTSQDK